MAKRPLDSVRFAAERFVLSTRCQKISDRTLKELSNGIQQRVTQVETTLEIIKIMNNKLITIQNGGCFWRFVTEHFILSTWTQKTFDRTWKELQKYTQ